MIGAAAAKPATRLAAIGGTMKEQSGNVAVVTGASSRPTAAAATAIPAKPRPTPGFKGLEAKVVSVVASFAAR